MGWVLRLVETGIEGLDRSIDVMAIDRPGDLGDIAALGLTLSRGKQLVVSHSHMNAGSRIIRAILCPRRRPNSIGIGADPVHTRTQISAEHLARRRCDDAMSHADAKTQSCFAHAPV